LAVQDLDFHLNLLIQHREHMFAMVQVGQFSTGGVGQFYSGANKNISFHALRHTYSNLMKAVGTPLIVTSRAMGHSNIGITGNRYTDVSMPELVAAARALNDVYGSFA